MQENVFKSTVTEKETNLFTFKICTKRKQTSKQSMKSLD